MVKISEINNQNPWWKYGKDFVKYDRHLSKAKGDLLFFERRELETSRENIYIIRGCRQIGKTTYLKEWIYKLIENEFNPRRILYLSLDFFTSRRELRNALSYFMDANREAQNLYVFLDEITTLKDWNLELKYLWDSGITKKAHLIATGSSGGALRRKGEFLPGRGLEGNEYYLKPLTFRDFTIQTTELIRSSIESKELYDALERLKNIIKKVTINLEWNLDKIFKTVNIILPFKKELEYLFRIYLITGGFPGVINEHLRNRFANKMEFIDSATAEIFVRNILGDVVKQGKQETFARRILREIIDKYGAKYTFSKLARNVEVSHVTFIDYLELLEFSLILLILHAYDFNKQSIKFKGGKKVYFQDPFIYYALKSSLTGADVNEVIAKTQEDEEALSKLIEGIVSSHLSMTLEKPLMKERETFLWFYYDTRGREIDNVMKLNESFIGIEVKYQRKVSPEDILRIPQIKKYIILSKEDVEFQEKILIVPIEIFLSLLPKSHHNL